MSTPKEQMFPNAFREQKEKEKKSNWYILTIVLLTYCPTYLHKDINGGFSNTLLSKYSSIKLAMYANNKNTYSFSEMKMCFNQMNCECVIQRIVI